MRNLSMGKNSLWLTLFTWLYRCRLTIGLHITCKTQSLLPEKSETEPRPGSGFSTIDDRSRSSEKLLLLLSWDADEERNGFGSKRNKKRDVKSCNRSVMHLVLLFITRKHRSIFFIAIFKRQRCRTESKGEKITNRDERMEEKKKLFNERSLSNEIWTTMH